MVYSEFRYVFGLYSVEIYEMSHNSLWYMRVRLREKQTVGTYHTHTHTQELNSQFTYICNVSNILFYVLCDNYEFKYVFKLYSEDICALSHSSSWYMCVKLRLRVQMSIILYSHLGNVSRFLAIVYKECKYMTYVALSNIQFMGSKTLFRLCILEICVTLTISYACLQGIHGVCVCVCVCV